MKELVKLNKQGTTIMMVTHDAKGAIFYLTESQTKKELTEAADIGYTYQGGIDFFKFIYQ